MGSSEPERDRLQKVRASGCVFIRSFACGLLFVTFATSALSQEVRTSKGIFSANASSLAKAYTDHVPVTVPSPDGQSKIVAQTRGEKFVLQVEGRMGALTLNVAYGPNTELQWSPDSEAFWITENSGGLMGPYQLTVVGRRNGQLSVQHLTKLVTNAFGHPIKCFTPEVPNVAGLTWKESSRELVAIAEIVPHSNCDNMGTFTAYIVDPWRTKVLQTLSQQEAKAQFRAAMGPRTLNAPDDCASNPKNCYLPQLHPGTKRR